MKHFVLQAFYLAPSSSMANSLEFRRVSPDRINSCLILNKIKIKPGILKLTIRRDQSSFRIVFAFGSCEEKGYLSCPAFRWDS